MTLLTVTLLLTAQIVSGIVVAAFVIHKSDVRFPTLVGLGSVLGILGFILGSQVTLFFLDSAAGWTALPLVAFILLVGKGRTTVRQVLGTGDHQWLLLSWIPPSIAAIVLQVPNWVRTPIRDGYVVGSEYHADLVFFEAVGQSVSQLGPGESLLLSDAPIRYHWFIYGWSGLMTRLSGVEAFWITTRLVPVLLIVLGALLAAQWARMLSTVRWVPALAAWLVVVAGYVGAEQGVIITFDSPSTGFASVVLLAFALSVTLALRAKQQAPVIGLVGFWAFALVGAKASHAAVAGIGIAFMAVVLTLRGDPKHRGVAWALTAATGLGTVAAYLLLLAGISGSDSQIGFGGDISRASTYQGLDPAVGLVGILLGTMILVLAMAPRWIGLLAQTGSRNGRNTPETWLGVGMILAGVLPLIALTSGTNAAWFALGASAPVAVLSAVGIGAMRDHVRLPQGAALPLAGGIAATAALAWLVTVLNYGLVQVSGAPVSWRAPVLAWIVAVIGALAVAPLLRGRWILRASFVLALAISATAILTRVSGPVLWNYTAGILKQPLSQFVLVLDPGAELATIENFRPEGSRRLSVGAVARSAAVPVPRQDYSQADLVANAIAFRAERIQWSPQRASAAELLSDLVESGDVVAMDASLSQPFLPVALGSPILLAGQPYTDGYTSAVAARTIPERFAAVDDFRLTAAPSAHRYLWDMGVRWLWLEFSPEGDAVRLEGVTETVFLDSDVAVVKLSEPGANSE